MGSVLFERLGEVVKELTDGNNNGNRSSKRM